jgi:ATP-dependent Clp protease ATP-binding subunit ClpA
MASKNVRVEVDESVHDWLVRVACADRTYGARPLRRAIQRHVEDPLSDEIIRQGGISEDGLVAHVSMIDGEIKFMVERIEVREVGVDA